MNYRREALELVYSSDRPKKTSLIDYDSDIYYNLLSKGMDRSDSDKFINICKSSMKYSEMFNDEFFLKDLPREEGHKYSENVLSFVLPYIRRVYYQYFIKSPTIFKDERLEAFKLTFDIEECLLFFSRKLKSNISILDNFENLDRYPTLLSIICDDFISLKVSEVKEFTNIKSTLRELKIKNGLGIHE